MHTEVDMLKVQWWHMLKSVYFQCLNTAFWNSIQASNHNDNKHAITVVLWCLELAMAYYMHAPMIFFNSVHRLRCHVLSSMWLAFILEAIPKIIKNVY